MRYIWPMVCLLLSGVTLAQQDPVLMKINGREVLRSEFERACASGDVPTDKDGHSLQHCLDRFVEFQLKVSAARSAGLDTLRAFKDEAAHYRNRLAEHCLLGEELAAEPSQTVRDSEAENTRVRVCQLFKYLPQNVSRHKLHAAEAQMDSLYDALVRGASFDDCAVRFSDDPHPFWVERLQMPVEFEDTVFALKPGTFSHPFFTPQGLHIVKVLERTETCSVASAVRRVHPAYPADGRITAAVERLKVEYDYASVKEAMNELRARGRTDRVLFTLSGKPYTGADFARFAAVHPAGIERQLYAFITKSVLDFANLRWTERHPELYVQLRAHEDTLLVQAITRQEGLDAACLNDSLLKTYFEAHRADYHWQHPRYRGAVIHAVSKRAAKQARRFLKGMPETEWPEAIRLAFRSEEGEPEVKAECGIYAPGENAYVDEQVFKQGKSTPVVSHPFTIVMGKKIKGPDHYGEVRARLQTDCRCALEGQWVDRLRAVSKVEINQEVLKTVNNH